MQSLHMHCLEILRYVLACNSVYLTGGIALLTFFYRLYMLYCIDKRFLSHLKTIHVSMNCLRTYTQYVWTFRSTHKSISRFSSYCMVWVPQVLDFFNSRMDMQQLDGEWSVDKVLEVINKTCRSWRGEGMKVVVLSFTFCLKFMYLWWQDFMVIWLIIYNDFFFQMFTQLRFTYEQESHPEEFFIPYAWRLVLSRG